MLQGDPIGMPSKMHAEAVVQHAYTQSGTQADEEST